MTQGTKDVALYGDESHFNEIVTYAFIIIPQKNRQLVESSVSQVKKNTDLMVVQKFIVESFLISVRDRRRISQNSRMKRY